MSQYVAVLKYPATNCKFNDAMRLERHILIDVEYSR